jgi:hypothetical protein
MSVLLSAPRWVSVRAGSPAYHDDRENEQVDAEIEKVDRCKFMNYAAFFGSACPNSLFQTARVSFSSSSCPHAAAASPHFHSVTSPAPSRDTQPFIVPQFHHLLHDRRQLQERHLINRLPCIHFHFPNKPLHALTF